MPTIDERVVRMSFDNRGFESNVSDTMSSLEKLKSSLNFSESADLNLSGINSGIAQLNKRFSAMGMIGMRTFNKLTDKVEHFAKTLASAVSTDAIKDGFHEYELQMDSVKTILASTKDAGENIDSVNKYLDELNQYADKTIYSFSDMTNNIGKFTNAGIKLEDAVMAIKGISNEAAVSGANAAEASRAMYNFSQALSSGSVKLRDWMSIENANMATAEFKQQLIDSAVELGTLSKEADGTYKVLTSNGNGAAMKETITNTKNFRDSLQYSWMTTEVLTKTLKNYADETTDIGKKAFEAAQQVSTFTKLIDTLKEALGSSWNRTFQLVIGDFEEATKFWTDVSIAVSGVIDSFGNARNELLEGWKKGGGRDDLISSLKNTWNGLKQVFGAIGESFRSIFPAMTSEQLIAITKKLKDLTAQFTLNDEQIKILKENCTGLFSIFKILQRIIVSIGKILKPVISLLKPIGTILVLITGSIGKFLTEVSKADNMLEYALKNVGTLITDISERLKNFDFDVGAAFSKGIEKLDKAITEIKEKIKSLFPQFGKDDDVVNATKHTNRFTEAIDKLKSRIKQTLGLEDATEDEVVKATKDSNKFISAIEAVRSKFEHLFKFKDDKSGKSPFSFFSSSTEKDIPLLSKIKESIQKINEAINSFRTDTFETIDKKVSGLKESFDEATKSVTGFFDKFKNKKSGGSDSSDVSKSMGYLDYIKERFSFFSDFFSKMGPKLTKSINSVFDNIPNLFKYLASDEFGKLLDNITKIFKIGLLGNVSKFVNKRNKDFSEMFGSINDTFKTISYSAKSVTRTVQTAEKTITNFFNSIDDSSKKKGKSSPFTNNNVANNILKMAASIGILTASIIPLSKLEPKQLAAGLSALVLEIQVLIRAFAAIKGLSKDLSEGGKYDFLTKAFSMDKLLSQLVKFGIVIKIVSSSVKSLGELKAGDLAKGIVGLYTITEMLIRTIKKLVSINESSEYGIVSLKAISTGLIAFGIGIRILAMSVKALGTVPVTQMLQGLVGVLVLLEAINAFTKEAKEYQISLQSAVALVLTIETIRMMTGAALKLGELNLPSFIKGMLGVLTFLEAINLFMKEVKGYQITLKSAAALVLTIETIKMMTSAAVSLGGLNFASYAQGMVGVLTFLESVNLFMKEVKSYNLDLKSVAALVLTIQAIKMMTSSALSLGGLDFPAYAQGLVGVLVLLEAINLFTKEAEKFKMDFQAASALVTVIGVIRIMAGVILQLATIEFGQFIQGVVGVVAFLQAINLFTQELSGLTIDLTSILAVVVIANSLWVASNVFVKISKLTTPEVTNGIIALGAMVLSLVLPVVILSNLENDILKSSACMLIMAASLALITPTIQVLGSMDMPHIIGMLVGLAGAFVILGGAALIIGKASIEISAGAIAILLMGAAMTAVGISMIAFGLGLSALAVGITAIVAAVHNSKDMIAEDIEDLKKYLMENANPVVSLISDFTKDSVNAFFDGIGRGAKESAPKLGKSIVESFADLMDSIADAIRNDIPKVLASFMNLFSAIIELTITCIQAVASLFGPFGQGIADKLEDAKLAIRKKLAPESMKEIGSDAMGEKGLAGGITAQESTVNNASGKLGNNILGALGGIIKGKGFDVGSLLGFDVSKGLLSTTGLLGNSATTTGNVIMDNLNMDFTPCGYDIGMDVGSGINSSQYDVSKYTQDFMNSIGSNFENSNVNFEKIGNQNVTSYIGTFTNSSAKTNTSKSAGSLADEGVSGAKSRRNDYVNAGKDSGRGYADGLNSQDIQQYVKTKAESLASTALTALQNKLDSHSPSRETMKIGAFGGEGFALGLASMARTVREKSAYLGGSALEGMRNALSNLSDMASSDMITDPMIRPVLDLTDIQNGIGTMDSMFGSPMVGLRASLAGTGDTVQDLYTAANVMSRSGSNNNDIVGEMIALRKDVKNLGQSMSQMKMYMDGREVGGIVSNEVDRRLGIRYLRNRREGRA